MRWFLSNERRVTPLMMAANNGDLSVIKALLESGAKKYVYSGRHCLYPLNFASRLSCSAFGFHSGNCPGYPASHGCIRMPYSAAKKLFGLTPVGTRVVIQQ